MNATYYNITKKTKIKRQGITAVIIVEKPTKTQNEKPFTLHEICCHEKWQQKQKERR